MVTAPRCGRLAIRRHAPPVAELECHPHGGTRTTFEQAKRAGQAPVSGKHPGPTGPFRRVPGRLPRRRNPAPRRCPEQRSEQRFPGRFRASEGAEPRARWHRRRERRRAMPSAGARLGDGASLWTSRYPPSCASSGGAGMPAFTVASARPASKQERAAGPKVSFEHLGPAARLSRSRTGGGQRAGGGDQCQSTPRGRSLPT